MFTDEDMPKVCSTGRTGDLRARSISVVCSFYTPGNGIVKSRSSASCVKLILAAVERRLAATTDIRSLRSRVHVLAGKRHFRSLIHDDVGLLRCELCSVCNIHEKSEITKRYSLYSRASKKQSFFSFS